MGEQKEKRKSRFHKIFPVMVTLAMVFIVIIQTMSLVFIIYYGKINGLEVSVVWRVCEELFAGNFITLGISIIAIAVSVWIGLNINIAIEKGELSEKIENLDQHTRKLEEAHQKRLLKFEDDQKNLVNRYEEKYKTNWLTLKRINTDFLKVQWIHMILTMSDQYPLSAYLGHILNNIDIDGDLQLINFLLNYENSYKEVSDLYERGLRDECIDKAEEQIALEVPDINVCEELQLYFAVRKSDFIFYRVACEIRNGNKRKELITQLEQSLEIYKELEQDRKILTFNDYNEVYAYIYNTIGYSYDLMNQIEVDQKRKEEAIGYLEKAVRILKGKSRQRGRYYRNLGLMYHRNNDLDNACRAFEESTMNNPGDEKNYVNIAGNILYRIENNLGISDRKCLLCEMDGKDFCQYKNDLEYVIELCEESIHINYLFEDPYYKIAQAYTYLFLCDKRQKTYILEAKKYLNKLERRGFCRDGYSFVLRNMYEAVGEVKESLDINNGIEASQTNDVEKMKELYEKYLEENEKNSRRREKSPIKGNTHESI